MLKEFKDFAMKGNVVDSGYRCDHRWCIRWSCQFQLLNDILMPIVAVFDWWR